MNSQLRIRGVVWPLACSALCWTALTSPACAQVTLFPVEHSYLTGPGRPFGCELADFDGDGVLDAVVSDFVGTDVQLYKGMGGGALALQGNAPAGNSLRGVTVADFNADGKPDIAAASMGDNTATVLLGLGGFAFAAPIAIPVGTYPVWVQAGDINGNGTVDLVSVSQEGAEMSVMLGDGLGGFAAAVSYPLGVEAEKLCLGDLNGDGALDAVVNSTLDNRLLIRLNNGAGVFAPGSTIVTNSLGGLALKDVNADGLLDVVTTERAQHRVLVFLGNGAGAFSSLKYYPVSNFPEAVQIADFTGDGRPDIVTVDAGSWKLTVLVNIGSGDFNLAQSSPTVPFPLYVTVGDIDLDGRTDAVVTSYSQSKVQTLLATQFTGWERYCTAKVNSLGCPPLIQASGSPSSSNLRPFRVQTIQLVPGTIGLYIYKVNGARSAIPFQGGTLCIGGGAIRRAPGLSSGPGDVYCEGSQTRDFNAFAAGQGGGNPDPALQTAGARYLVQYWGRDPGSAPFFSSLSAALDVDIGP